MNTLGDQLKFGGSTAPGHKTRSPRFFHTWRPLKKAATTKKCRAAGRKAAATRKLRQK